jgi:hypothetical protein
MSGQEGIRGYIFQSIFAVLESLQTDWDYICVEPNTENDKIDIIWTDKNSDEKVYQIKSSITDFSKADILSWLIDLYKDNSSAILYSVILIGNSSTATKEYFKKFKSLKLSDFDEKNKKLFAIKDKVNVDFYHLNYPAMKAAIIANIDRFLSSNDINVDFFTKELICGGLLNQFMFFSTSGRKVSKSQFENELLNWLKHNYSKQISKSNYELFLTFYLTSHTEFSDTFLELGLPNIVDSDLIEKRKNELIDLYNNVLSYKVKIKNKKDSLSESFSNNIFNLYSISDLSRTFPPYKNQPVAISEYDKINICQKVKELLSITVSKDFFEFGDLKVTNNSISFGPFGNNIILSGTDNEKKKKETYDTFEIKLENLNDLLIFWSKIQDFNFLPIVLNNASSSYEKGLRIKLFFPKEVKIIFPNDFPCPERIDILKEFNEIENILINLCKHQKDSKVNEFYSKKYLKHIQGFETTYPLFAMSSFNERKSKRIEQYYDILNYYFDYEIFYDNPDYTVLECDVDELSANEAISLPSFIFYKSDNNFNIEYEINSKNLSKKINGILNVKI